MRRLVLLAGLVVGLALPGLAHGTWTDARPLPGVTVGGVVDEVAFLFPEPLVAGQGSITVAGPDGSRHPTGSLEHPADAVVRMGIEPLVDEGVYTVTFTLPAVDGFVFSGSHHFEYRATAPGLEPLPYGRGGNLPLIGVGLAAAAFGGWVLVRRRK
ncbi:MAG: copper resistance protein CopC [Acidimicrobiia bacterium]